MVDRKEVILKWLERFERSGLSAPAFFAKYCVPFSLVQFYRYRKSILEGGIDSLTDGRSQGNHRRVHGEAEGFLMGYVSAHPSATEAELQRVMRERFGIEISQPGMSQCLKRLGIRRPWPRQRAQPLRVPLVYAGFELVVALAWHFGWPQRTAEVIGQATARARRSKCFAAPEGGADVKGRSRGGQFTARYNRRRQVRVQRFQSVEDKRRWKSLRSMDVGKVKAQTLARKCLGVLTLPFVTRNGEVRTVNTALGKSLQAFCGFQYKQATLARFVSELKYLGVAEDLLRDQVAFWQQVWREELPVEENFPLLCYYVDGHTKALWSKKRVKKNKVTMLGRVMGCLEQVFVHDSHGRPIYFETYSGHAPMGEYILSLFEKIEDSLEGAGPKLAVQRAIVMDAASNSVRTLRAFACQKKYHYITSLDANQWDPRKIRKQGKPQRYRHGAATLWECEIELKDSREKDYLFVTRAIKILWDKGKETYLITSLPKAIVGASVVVKAYFDRWPYEELPFKVMKAVGCLNRVAGYGKQKLPDKEVQKRQRELACQIQDLKEKLSEPQAALEREESRIATLSAKERRLRARSQIVEGRRILPRPEAQELKALSGRIAGHQRRLKAIGKAHSAVKKLERLQREWLRLQGKETVYKVDVELDQIMTYFRVSLVNLYSYLARLLGWSHLSLVKFLYTVLFLAGRVEETPGRRHVILERNEKDPQTMAALNKALAVINNSNIRNIAGQKLTFGLD